MDSVQAAFEQAGGEYIELSEVPTGGSLTAF
jgi:hypothetical protein